MDIVLIAAVWVANMYFWLWVDKRNDKWKNK